MEEVPFYNTEKNYQTVERALKILEIIRKFSDEENTITQRKIMDEMKKKGESTNERTISSTIRKLLEALNKESNNDSDTHKYRILYNGCDNKNKKMQHISGLRYVHDFSFEELDTIISTMYLSKELSGKDRDNLICKLAKLSSKNYYNKWVSENNKKPIIKKVFQDISENNNASKTELRKNIGIVSEAIEYKKKVRFVFNGYDANKQLEPTTYSDGRVEKYVVTPYHIITYNGKYYLICNKDQYDNVSIWRMDLMTGMEILKDSVGRLKSEVKGLPIDENYNKFMSEHLNMFYDEPENIRLKVRKDRYTVLYDWFGENFTVWRESNDDEYDLVMVKTSPNAMVNFAMQYSDVIQVVGPKKVLDQIEIKCNNILKSISESKK